MVKALKDARPSMKREEWKDHIRHYERLKSQLNQRRNTTGAVGISGPAGAVKINPFLAHNTSGVAESILP
jgi:hypothetical protein